MKELAQEISIEEEISDKRLASLGRYLKQLFSSPRKSLKDYWTSENPRLQEAIRTFVLPNVPVKKRPY